MSASGLLARIGRKGADHRALAESVSHDPARIAEVLDGLGARDPRVKYGCAKVLEVLSEAHPAVLYPMFDRIADLLEGDNKILQWEAIRIIANLARVDKENSVERILDRYLAPVCGPVLVTAANVIGGAATIAAAKPHLVARIASDILKVEHGRYQTTECRNVALGQAILALDSLVGQVAEPQPILEWVQRRVRNRRAATRRKAQWFLLRHAEQDVFVPRQARRATRTA